VVVTAVGAAATRSPVGVTSIPSVSGIVVVVVVVAPVVGVLPVVGVVLMGRDPSLRMLLLVVVSAASQVLLLVVVLTSRKAAARCGTPRVCEACRDGEALGDRSGRKIVPSAMRVCLSRRVCQSGGGWGPTTTTAAGSQRGQSVGQSRIFLDAGALPLFTMLH